MKKKLYNRKKSFSVKKVFMLFLLSMLTGGSFLYAQIPAVISANYLITGGQTETCLSPVCTVQAGYTLTIELGSTAIFEGNLKIEQGAKVELNGSTIKMAPNKRILVQGFTIGTLTPLSLGGAFNALNSTITGTDLTQFWKGIETERIGYINNLSYGNLPAAHIWLRNSTLSYAEIGVKNFSTTQQPNFNDQVGTIEAKDVLFLNNQKNAANILDAIDIYSIQPPAGPPNWINEDINFLRCTFQVTNDFSEDPTVFVFLENSFAVRFTNCIFKGKTDPIPAVATGIYGRGSSIKVQPEYLGTSGGHFSYLKNGIVLDNQLKNDGSTLIHKAFFGCQNAVNISGTISPRILGNQSIGAMANATGDYHSFFLRNCPTFQMEGNFIAYDPDESGFRYSGITIMNSGPANNEVYRNFVETANLDIQSIGTNRSDDGKKGLKILCNNLSECQGQMQYDDYNITVMNDIIPNSTNGVHNLQYMESGNPLYDFSAGNWFLEYPIGQPPSVPLNYYLENGTNIINDFVYKYNPSSPQEEPVYRNFPNLQSSQHNKCISHNDGIPLPPFPFYNFVNKLNTIENTIQQIENKTTKNYADTLQLSYLLGQHGKLIDSIANYHLFENQIDSLALVYEQVTIGYHYKILLSLLYRDRDHLVQQLIY